MEKLPKPHHRQSSLAEGGMVHNVMGTGHSIKIGDAVIHEGTVQIFRFLLRA
jgi:hypothetical protein